MELKKCLKCQKEFQPERETRKFCSTSCRVRYHQINGKKEVTIKPEQRIKIMYNSFLEAVDEFKGLMKQGGLPPSALNKPVLAQQAIYAPEIRQTAAKRLKTVNEYAIERQDLDTQEGYEKWLYELDNDTNLSVKQKDLAKTLIIKQ